MRTWAFERLEERILLCGDGNLAAQPIGSTDVVVEQLSDADRVDVFRFTLDQPGRMTIETRPAAGSLLETRTGLLDASGKVLIHSDGQSAQNAADLIVQHLVAGTYFVQVQGLRGGAGEFALVTQFDPATPAAEPLEVNFDREYPFAVSPPYHVAGDFNGDGHLDIATPNTWTSDVSILLGLGDGSFAAARNFAVGAGPFGIAAADFNADGRMDVATVNQNSNDVSILLATGDETLFAAELRGEKIHGFGSSTSVGVGGPSGAVSWGMTSGDFNGDGRIDLVFANLRTNDVSVLLGNGDGTFQAERQFAVGTGPNGVLAADVDGDGRLDLVTANFNDNSLSLLLGVGDGTFQPQRRIPTGPNPSLPVAADLNGDGRIDLAVANAGADSVWIFWNQGDATFASHTEHAAGTTPYGLVALDFDRDGAMDLATSNRSSHDVSVLLGRADGAFLEQERYRVGLQPWNLIAGDFNGDQRPDLSTANARSHDVSVLLGLGDGNFQRDPTAARQDETNPQGMVARDFNHDGVLDLAAVTYSGRGVLVFLGRGDGTFRERMQFDVGSTPLELLSEDFNRDGHADLASINCDSGDLSVLLGRGDGTFQDQTRYGSSISGEWGLTDDFNGDGLFDIVASGQFASGIAILLGREDGTFGERAFFALDEAPADGASGDFNGDGRLDLATTNFFAESHDVSVHLGQGDGTFAAPQHFPVGEFPLGIVAGDFNKDGFVDLVNSNFRSQSVSLLAGRGDGTFEPEVRFATGSLPDFLLARDFDGDGHLDLAVSNAGAENVSVLRGRGDGTFDEQATFAAGEGPTPRRGIDAGDFNGDGKLDLALPQVLSSDVAILPGTEGAAFGEPLHFPAGLGPVALAAGDFNGDGRLDAASVNPTTNELTISLGAGDTTLAVARRVSVGLAPVALAAGDFNRDGRLDLATANHGSSDISLLLGTGAGAFGEQLRLSVGTNPTALATADFNGDGRLDLATANATSRDISILLGRGDGTFQTERRLAAGELPQALAIGDFNGDGRIDLAVADYRAGQVAVYFGLGDGSFSSPLALAVGSGPTALAAGDFDSDGALDLATANYLSHDVSVLRGHGDGTFLPVASYAAGTGPVSLTSGDFNGDGQVDLGAANSRSDDVTLLLARGDGSFAEPIRRGIGDYPSALASADFNGDARTDLVFATQLTAEPAVLQGLGDATFAEAGAISNHRRATPLVADYDGDGLLDVALLDLQGRILLRTARPDAAGFYNAPQVLNPDGQFAARDVAVLSSLDDSVLAALDAKSATLSIYVRQHGGAFLRHAGPHVPGKLPVAIRSGDLDGDGRLDLVVAAAGSNQVFVYLQAAGQSAALLPNEPDYALDVGNNPSAIELADLDSDGRLDVLVTSQFSGTVSVFYNHADDPFSCESRFATSVGVYGLVEQEFEPAVRSLAAPAGLAAASMAGSDGIDVLVANAGENSVAWLPASGSGGLFNPALERTFAAGQRPTSLVTGDFNGDSLLDVAVLNEVSADVSLLLGRSDGGLTPHPRRVPAGNQPTGLAASDVNADGRLDLLVGNDFGDLLVLLGHGDGSFQPYQRADGRVALVVADLDGDGQQDFVFSSHADDAVEVQYAASGDSFRQLRSDGLLAPEAVASADLNRDGVGDLVIANSGANNVLVYLGRGDGTYQAARRFFAGTRPVGVTIDDLNNDGRPDLVVANEGSNDLTILLGHSAHEQWTLVDGPRLRAGTGPVQTLVRDETRDGVPDILVTNSRSNDVFLLAGLGLGFFDDVNPLVRLAGERPTQLLPIEGGLVTINRQSNDITYFANFLSSPGVAFASGGQLPSAGVVGDFDGDSFSDLLVAHQGDGVVRLLAGGPAGFSLSASFNHEALPHPAALALRLQGQQLEVYGVNEYGRQAVLITALADLTPAAPLAPFPLAGLLLVIAPGFEPALSTLVTQSLFNIPLRGEAGESGALRAAATLEASGATGEQAPSPESEQDPDDDHRDAQQQAVDAAISQLLSGVQEALKFRPPQLPWPPPSPPGEFEPAGPLGSRWFSQVVDWLAAADWTPLGRLLPLTAFVPPCVSLVLEAANSCLASEAESAAGICDPPDIAAAAVSPLADSDACWAAMLALSLSAQSCAATVPSRNKSRHGRARYSRRTRPYS